MEKHIKLSHQSTFMPICQSLYSQVKRCSSGPDAQCLQSSRWETQLDVDSILKRVKYLDFKHDLELVTGMPGAGSQYSVMGRPQDPRSSMFGSSINLNGEFSSAKSKTKVKWTFTYVYTFGSLIKLNGEFSVFGGLKATKTKCIAMHYGEVEKNCWKWSTLGANFSEYLLQKIHIILLNAVLTPQESLKNFVLKKTEEERGEKGKKHVDGVW